MRRFRPPAGQSPFSCSLSFGLSGNSSWLLFEAQERHAKSRAQVKRRGITHCHLAERFRRGIQFEVLYGSVYLDERTPLGHMDLHFYLVLRKCWLEPLAQAIER